jgi:hypothetical protein
LSSNDDGKWLEAWNGLTLNPKYPPYMYHITDNDQSQLHKMGEYQPQGYCSFDDHYWIASHLANT